MATRRRSPKNSWLIKNNRQILAFIIFTLLVILGTKLFLTEKNYNNSGTPQSLFEKSASKDTKETEDRYYPTDDWITFTGDGFTFIHPPEYILKEKNPDKTTWAGVLGGEEIPERMILLSQDTAFEAPIAEPSSNENIYIEQVVQSKIMSGNLVFTKYVYDCGVDCRYHMIDFKINNKFYRLKFFSAAGGLGPKFNQIVSSLKFTN